MQQNVYSDINKKEDSLDVIMEMLKNIYSFTLDNDKMIINIKKIRFLLVNLSLLSTNQRNKFLGILQNYVVNRVKFLKLLQSYTTNRISMYDLLLNLQDNLPINFYDKNDAVKNNPISSSTASILEHYLNALKNNKLQHSTNTESIIFTKNQSITIKEVLETKNNNNYRYIEYKTISGKNKNVIVKEDSKGNIIEIFKTNSKFKESKGSLNSYKQYYDIKNKTNYLSQEIIPATEHRLQHIINIQQQLHKDIYISLYLIKTLCDKTFSFQKKADIDLHDYILSILNDNNINEAEKNKKIILLMTLILNVVNKIHEANIIHNDIKLQNFVISIADFTVKVIDFDLAKTPNQIELKHQESIQKNEDYEDGTPGYQTLLNKPDRSYNDNLDIHIMSKIKDLKAFLHIINTLYDGEYSDIENFIQLFASGVVEKYKEQEIYGCLSTILQYILKSDLETKTPKNPNQSGFCKTSWILHFNLKNGQSDIFEDKAFFTKQFETMLTKARENVDNQQTI